MTQREKFLYCFNKENKENVLKEYELINYIKYDKYKVKHLICGNVFESSYKTWMGRGYRCNNPECVKERRENTCLIKYGNKNGGGTKESIQKIKNSFKKRNIESEHEKSKNTMLKKYGIMNYNNPMKSKSTCLKIYGNKNYRGNYKMSEYFYDNHLMKMKDISPMFSKKEYIGVRDDSIFNVYKWKCKKCGNVFDDRFDDGIPICRKCHPKLRGVSNIEKDFFNWVSELVECIPNKRFYFDDKRYYEVDILIPSMNIGIELNGVYWHSELAGKDSKYHINKMNYFNKKGIHIINIWDLEWINKQEIVKSMIKSKLGMTENKIFARKCEIKELGTKEKNKFFDDNHLQGKVKSSINISLVHDNQNVSVMSFTKCSRNKKHQWELSRFSSNKNTTVVGGFSKMLNYFTKKYSGSIISYADSRWSNGNVYEKNNFELHGINSPSYYYFNRKSNNLIHKSNFKKENIKKKFSENYDDNLTEWENMQNNGYNRVWDCGKKVFVYKYK